MDATEDNEDEALLKDLDEPEDEEDAEAADDVDKDREASNAAVIAALDDEMEDDELMDLTHEDINLGHFSVQKVFLPSLLLSIGLD